MPMTALLGTAAGTIPGVGWNVVDQVRALTQYAFLRQAFVAGAIVAVVAGGVGYFVVLRASAFAAHAQSHIGFAGAAGAVVLGLSPVVGLLAFTMAAGIVIGVLGSRLRGRDVEIGVVLAWALGLGALFIRLYTGYATQTYTLLFGDVYAVSQSDLAVLAVAATIIVATLATVARPLLFASVDEDVAAARGVPIRLMSVVFMLVLAVAVSEAVQVVGVLLVFALLVTPAAIAERLTARPLRAAVLAAALSLAFTWAGIVVDFYTSKVPSFYITTFAFLSYVAVRLHEAWQERRRLPRARTTV